MKSLRGRVIGGSVVLDAPPPEWVEGEKVRVLLDRDCEFNEADWLDSLDQGDDPESIERWIAAVNAIPKSSWTDEDEARWQAARAEQKAFELSKWEENAAKLKAMFE